MKYKALFAAALLVIAGIPFAFYRMYRHDMVTLQNFMASYERFDTTIVARTDGEVTDALVDLESRARERISSLIKRDAEAMGLMHRISDIAQREFDTLTAGQDSTALRREREAAYAHLRELERAAD